MTHPIRLTEVFDPTWVEAENNDGVVTGLDDDYFCTFTGCSARPASPVRCDADAWPADWLGEALCAEHLPVIRGVL